MPWCGSGLSRRLENRTHVLYVSPLKALYNDIQKNLQEPLSGIISTVKTALEQTPPELGSDVAERGLVLTGGGALLGNLDFVLRASTGLPVSIADDPLTSVVMGTGKLLNEFDLLRKVSLE